MNLIIYNVCFETYVSTSIILWYTQYIYAFAEFFAQTQYKFSSEQYVESQSYLVPRFQNEASCKTCHMTRVDLHENESAGETHFHMNSFALRLVLTEAKGNAEMAYCLKRNNLLLAQLNNKLVIFMQRILQNNQCVRVTWKLRLSCWTDEVNQMAGEPQ